MSVIDDRVRELLNEGNAAVVIVCGDNCAAVAAALRAASIDVDEGAADVGSISAVIDEEKLKTLESTEGIIRVEPDEEVSTF